MSNEEFIAFVNANTPLKIVSDKNPNLGFNIEFANGDIIEAIPETGSENEGLSYISFNLIKK